MKFADVCVFVVVVLVLGLLIFSGLKAKDEKKALYDNMANLNSQNIVLSENDKKIAEGLDSESARINALESKPSPSLDSLKAIIESDMLKYLPVADCLTISNDTKSTLYCTKR